MKKYVFEKEFSVDEVVDMFDGSVVVDDFKKSGVYMIDLGSRGEVEDVVMVSDVNELLVCESVDELYNKYYKESEIVEEWDDEIIESMKMDMVVSFDDGMYSECMNDEVGFNYMFIRV